uniref:Uncharacterized protein n=1 Tax=Utricularia reniformis TaxID=192314 RepID=A0A1Y0AZA1_9LAMI|nr:hypothetical protein AEK19_MT0179 [Utricularia reniformis]ART30461.1 hypothetical protein AEK19_MT0179 [Utricularia reniformis]
MINELNYRPGPIPMVPLRITSMSYRNKRNEPKKKPRLVEGKKILKGRESGLSKIMLFLYS